MLSCSPRGGCQCTSLLATLQSSMVTHNSSALLQIISERATLLVVLVVLYRMARISCLAVDRAADAISHTPYARIRQLAQCNAISKEKLIPTMALDGRRSLCVHDS
eukprot:14675-Heterococcus_DN1.PRE.3